MNKRQPDPHLIEFIVRLGILRFGSLFAAAMIVYVWLTTPFTLARFIEYSVYIIIVAAILGALAWVYFFRLAKPFLRWLLPRLRR
jgi:hypothetical protein